MIYFFPDFSFEEAYLMFVYNLDFCLEDPRYHSSSGESITWPKITESDKDHLVVEMELYEYQFETRGNVMVIKAMSLY